MRKVLARPWVGVRVSHLLLLLLQVRVETFSVSSCYRDRDKLRSDGPLGSYADLTLVVKNTKQDLAGAHHLELPPPIYP